MSAYLTVDEFKLLTTAGDYVADVEAAQTGWLGAQLSAHSARINAQLRKRYATPFAAPIPEQVQLWLAQIVTEALYLRRGVDAQDEQFVSITEIAARAREEIKEAANAQDGLWDLPLNETSASLVTRGGPIGYSEASPYVWSSVQAERASSEDENGSGTFYG